MINLLIHPAFRSPDHKHFKKVRIYTWAMLVIGTFLIPYCIYFLIEHPKDTVKNYTNIVFTVLFLSGLLFGRFSRSHKYPILFMAIISYPPIMISIYHTGGIYSVDMIWIFLCLCSQCVFVDYRIGIVSSIVIIFFYTYLYLIEHSLPIESNHFKEYILQHNGTHNFFTLVFVTILITVLLTTFAKTLSATNAKLDELTKEKIYTLEKGLLKKTKELSQIRQTLARDFHDEMGNTLASISLLSQTARLKINDQTPSEEINQLLTTIEIRTRELYEGTKDFIWSIDLKSDYADELFVYIRDFGEAFFEPLEISFYSSYQKNNEFPARLAAATGRQVVYVCKEIMTNSAKHANCSEVTFELNIRETLMEIFIKDNGKGFTQNSITKRGLHNIAQRTEAIGGQYERDSSFKGTSYKITIPLNQDNLAILDSTGN